MAYVGGNANHSKTSRFWIVPITIDMKIERPKPILARCEVGFRSVIFQSKTIYIWQFNQLGIRLNCAEDIKQFGDTVQLWKKPTNN